jgi:hypothetical protein
MRMRLAIAVGIMAFSVSIGLAEPDHVAVPLKTVKVLERGLELPFDFKTEPDIKVRQKDPAVLNSPTVREHRPFFGLGISRPIQLEN